MKDYSHLFSKTGNSDINNFEPFKRFGTFFDLLIDLLNENIIINDVKQEQKEMIDKIEDFILLKEKSIMKKKTRSIIKKATTKTQRKEILRAQKSVKNTLNLLDKREVIIYEILNRYIYPGDVERDINHHLKLV